MPIATRAGAREGEPIIVRRPALRYHGGKWRIANWLIGHMPAHRTYVEPYGGAASVLLRKARVYAEVYNDLDEEVVNLFSVLRDPADAERLQRMCELTPYARREFERAYEVSEDPLERARRLLVRSFMGHGSSGVRKHRTGFRSNHTRSHTTPASDWMGWPAAIAAISARLRGVIIECRPAPDIIARFDATETLFYVDPPYLFGTRSQKRKGNDLYHGYRHELTDDQHVALLAQLREIRGHGGALRLSERALPTRAERLAHTPQARSERCRRSPNRSVVAQSGCSACGAFMTLLYARAPFQQLKAGAYDLALIDPPWANQNRSEKGEAKSSVAQYGKMEFEEIYALPVRDLLKRDAVIVLCCTWPLLLWGGDVRRHYAGHDAGMSPQGMCLKRWGARYSTGGVWRKITKTGKIARGTRYRVWNVCDPWIIGIIGSPKTIGLENCIDGIRREHSASRPIKKFCEDMMPGARRIELFSRESRSGWDTWGLQAGKFDPVVTRGAAANDAVAA